MQKMHFCQACSGILLTQIRDESLKLSFSLRSSKTGPVTFVFCLGVKLQSAQFLHYVHVTVPEELVKQVKNSLC